VGTSELDEISWGFGRKPVTPEFKLLYKKLA
jgi:hypothetical protein